jgi:hypothetical protein
MWVMTGLPELFHIREMYAQDLFKLDHTLEQCHKWAEV